VYGCAGTCLCFCVGRQFIIITIIIIIIIIYHHHHQSHNTPFLYINPLPDLSTPPFAFIPNFPFSPILVLLPQERGKAWLTTIKTASRTSEEEQHQLPPGPNVSENRRADEEEIDNEEEREKKLKELTNPHLMTLSGGGEDGVVLGRREGHRMENSRLSSDSFSQNLGSSHLINCAFPNGGFRQREVYYITGH